MDQVSHYHTSSDNSASLLNSYKSDFISAPSISLPKGCDAIAVMGKSSPLIQSLSANYTLVPEYFLS
jgi:hypothetical protein